MSITSVTQQRSGNGTVVTAVSDLSGTVFFHWYVDGLYVGMSTAGIYSFFLDQDDQVRIDVVDTTNPAFDPLASPPVGHPARHTIFFVRSKDADVVEYRLAQKKDAEADVDIARVNQRGEWQHRLISPRLDDLSNYKWTVFPIDAAGNEGTSREIGDKTVVRTPDAPNFAIAFDAGTSRVTFSEVA